MLFMITLFSGFGLIIFPDKKCSVQMDASFKLYMDKFYPTAMTYPDSRKGWEDLLPKQENELLPAESKKKIVYNTNLPLIHEAVGPLPEFVHDPNWPNQVFNQCVTRTKQPCVDFPTINVLINKINSDHEKSRSMLTTLHAKDIVEKTFLQAGQMALAGYGEDDYFRAVKRLIQYTLNYYLMSDKQTKISGLFYDYSLCTEELFSSSKSLEEIDKQLMNDKGRKYLTPGVKNPQNIRFQFMYEYMPVTNDYQTFFEFNIKHT